MPVALLWSRMVSRAARCWAGVCVRTGQSRLRWVLTQTPRISRFGGVDWAWPAVATHKAATANISFFMVFYFRSEVE